MTKILPSVSFGENIQLALVHGLGNGSVGHMCILSV
jgi:hypothetical protein